jgi:hypothetical protein
MGAKEADCCEHEHDHGHDDHDHSSCGHDHSHDHSTAKADHDHSCCGHDHGHAHSHEHHHHAEAESHDHAHGILDESGPLGRIIAIMILAVPVTYAAIKTPDNYSANAVMNKGLYNPSYGQAQGGNSQKYSLKKGDTANPAPASVAMNAPVADSLPEDTITVKPSDGLPVPNPKEIEKQAAKDGAEAKSYGNFTLDDLKAQIAQSPEGNFMLEVPEIYYTAGDKEVQSVLNGQPVETVAQVLPEKVNNEKGTRVRIFRLQVQCCAADARPYSIPVDFGKAPPKFKDMSWVKVTGKITFKQEGDQTVPVLEATTMTEATEPDSKMVY